MATKHNIIVILQLFFLFISNTYSKIFKPNLVTETRVYDNNLNNCISSYNIEYKDKLNTKIYLKNLNKEDLFKKYFNKQS